MRLIKKEYVFLVDYNENRWVNDRRTVIGYKTRYKTSRYAIVRVKNVREERKRFHNADLFEKLKS